MPSGAASVPLADEAHCSEGAHQWLDQTTNKNWRSSTTR